MEAKWLREGRLVYALVPTGRYSRGFEVSENLWTALVQPGPQADPGEAERIATMMQAAPALVEALKEAEELQATYYGDATGLHIAMIKWAAAARQALSQALGGE